MGLFDLKLLGRLILASGSPRRVELVREMGIEPAVLPQDVDETPLPDEGARALVTRLARLKATSALADAREGDIILAADTTVAIHDKELGKPSGEAEARAMLAELSGLTHEVYTGVCLIRKGNPNQKVSFSEVTEVEFYDLSEEDIAAYVATGEPLDKAGAYGIQGLGRALVREIRGDYFNVVGLPVAHTLRELARLAEAKA